jgi:hypothetical protein
MASNSSSAEFLVQDKLNKDCAFNPALSRVKSLLDTGMLLLVTAKRFDRNTKARANSLDGAKRCQLRVEEDLWKFQEPSEFSQVSAGINRLSCEISALS